MNKVYIFLDKYKKYYPEFKDENIRKKICYGFHCDTDQILCHLGLINIKQTAYYNFYKVIKNSFQLTNKKIIEVCSGLIPIVSSIIKQNETVKSITALNSNFLFKNYKNVKTIKANLKSKELNFSQADLIIGFRPCSPTENIMDMAIKFKKDFVLYLCPCDNIPTNSHESLPSKEWIKYLLTKLYSLTNYEIKIIQDNNMQDNMPIIIAKYIN